MTKDIDLKQQIYDVVIVGGGMIGAAQAVAMAKQHRRVLLIEKTIPTENVLTQIPLRVSAVNLVSEKYLNELQIWRHINKQSKCMFDQLATWEHRQHPLIFRAQDIKTNHLGHLIRNEALQLASFAQITLHENMVTVLSGASISTINQLNNEVLINLNDKSSTTPSTIRCSLLIGADGAFSQVRALSDIGTTGWDYQQHCLSVTIKTDFPTQHITWQEFQPSGPKAFLPLDDGYATLIWYDAPKRLEQLKTLNNEQLKQQILEVFPPLAGDFSVVQTASFPLTRRQANQYIKGRIVLVGDSAHTINPLAGQGVNIGYKDVELLSNLLIGVDLTDMNNLSNLLTTYQSIRKRESKMMSVAMDSFYTLFSNDKTPAKLIRNGLLNVANKFEWAKKQVLKKAVGY